MSQDPIMYPDPDVFKPERHIRSEDGSPLPLDPRLYLWGMGKRLVSPIHFLLALVILILILYDSTTRSCPGRYIVETWLYTFVVNFLATTSILAPIDSEGKTVPVVPEFRGVMVSYVSLSIINSESIIASLIVFLVFHLYLA